MYNYNNRGIACTKYEGGFMKKYFSKSFVLFMLFFSFLLSSCQKDKTNLVNVQVSDVTIQKSVSSLPQNGTMMQFFHWYTNADGSLWNEVSSKSPSLNNLGVTALWLPPAYKGAGGANDVGYGVYDMYDLGEFDQKGSIRTKYGTKDQYLAAINTAHANGIQIYGDVVFNHRGGADATETVTAVRVAKDNRNYEYGGDQSITAWTSFDFPGRANKYSSFKWHWYDFDGVDWADNIQDSSIWKFRGVGKGWDWEVDSANQNYDYLMYADLDMDHPEVVQELKNWSKWYTDFTNIDGFRLDAVKHIKFGFFNEWLDYIRNATGKELFTVGEYWSYNIGQLHNFITKTGGRMSLFDAPLHMNFYTASKSGGNYDMRYLMNNTLMKENPTKAVTIIDNHDTQPLQALESPVDYWFKPLAYAFILLREEGYPNVFYPDLYGATYTDKGKDGNTYTITLAPVQKLDKLMEARKLFAYGKQNSYMDHWDVIGWTREGDSRSNNKAMATIMSDGPGGSKWMATGKANTVFYDYLGNRTDKITTNADGWGEFKVNGGSVSVWVQE